MPETLGRICQELWQDCDVIRGDELQGNQADIELFSAVSPSKGARKSRFSWLFHGFFQWFFNDFHGFHGFHAKFGSRRSIARCPRVSRRPHRDSGCLWCRW